MCVRTESLPCSGTTVAPNGLWRLGLTAVRVLAVPTLLSCISCVLPASCICPGFKAN